jgi:pSer/pThr/pTyr-binding forkhead associated (FHA) protein
VERLMDAKLVVVGGNAKPAEIKLNLPVTIGRGRHASLMLPHPHISRQHCEIFEANGTLMVRDLDSMNGTFVNNQRIDESVLAPGALLTLGPITFRAVYQVGLPAESGAGPATSRQPPLEVHIQPAAGSPHDLQGRTEGTPAVPPVDAGGEEKSTEVTDVDSAEFLRQVRAAQGEYVAPPEDAAQGDDADGDQEDR